MAPWAEGWSRGSTITSQTWRYTRYNSHLGVVTPDFFGCFPPNSNICSQTSSDLKAPSDPLSDKWFVVVSCLCFVHWSIGWLDDLCDIFFFYAHVFGILEPCPSLIPLQGWNRCSAAESPHQGSGCAASLWFEVPAVEMHVLNTWKVMSLPYVTVSDVIICHHKLSYVIMCHHMPSYVTIHLYMARGILKAMVFHFLWGRTLPYQQCHRPRSGPAVAKYRFCGKWREVSATVAGCVKPWVISPKSPIFEPFWQEQNGKMIQSVDKLRDLGITYNYNYILNLYNTTYVCNIYI